MFVITGATGNIGKVIASNLLEKGKKVRAIGRNAEKLKELTAKGAEPFVGDLYDGDFVKKAFKGATAVFCMIPPNYQSKDFRRDQQRVARNYVNAVKENGIKHVVLLSSIGAHLRNGAGVVDGLGDMEEYFSELKDVNVLILRPGYFMENSFGMLNTIKQGIIGSTLKADIKVPHVATKDIAEVGSKRLLDLNFKGQTIEYVLGPEDLTFSQIATIIGNAVGKPDLMYVQFSFEEAKKSMVSSGFVSENLAQLFNELSEGMNSGKVLNAHKRTKENSTPTTMAEFAKVLVQAYHQMEMVH
jgi:uncharacterized protein YbjT (DUF2867 family)